MLAVLQAWGRGVFVFPRLNCMQRGVHSVQPTETVVEEETAGAQEQDEFEVQAPPSEWFAKDVVEYDGGFLPPPPVARILPESPEQLSEASASLSFQSEHTDTGWGENEMLEEEEVLSSASSARLYPVDGHHIDIISHLSLGENHEK